jgi:UDP-N-acetylmuramate dehydrogenase
MSFEWPRDLFASCPGVVVREGVSMAQHTTLGVGGRVGLYVEPATVEGMIEAVRALGTSGLPYRVLGGGSNLLVPDGDLPFAVLSPARLTRVTRDGDRLQAWAGASFPGFVRGAREAGLAGVSGLIGIPGQVGGAVRMNAGGKYGWFWDVIESAEVITRAGELRTITKAEAQPKYRDGNLGDVVVLAANVVLAPGKRDELYAHEQQVLREKHASQPLTQRSAGCIFKNPPGPKSAGRLIEEAGMKGKAVGGAKVSERHGNFIVNEGGATYAQVLELIAWTRNAVQERCGVELELEVDVWKQP